MPALLKSYSVKSFWKTREVYLPTTWKPTARTSFTDCVQTVALQAWIVLGAEEMPFHYKYQSQLILRVICTSSFLLVRLLLL